METTPKIYKAIIGIMNDIGAIGKTSKNTTQNFFFRGIDAVMNALQPALIKHNVFIIPNIIDYTVEERASKSGSAMIYATIKIKYTFVCAEDGSSIESTIVTTASDSSDKFFNKALSVAFKYTAFQVLCIPTEDFIDPDAETHEVKSDPSKINISTAQAKNMLELSRNDINLCKQIAQKYGYDKSTDIKLSDYESICADIKKAVIAKHEVAAAQPATDNGDTADQISLADL